MSEAPDPRSTQDPSLGDLLREARESRGLELSDVAGITHVRREYLSALEEGRYRDLPEDVYSKNFLRLFAQAVGFDVVRAQEIYRSERRDADVFNTVEERLERDNEIAADVRPIENEARWWEGPGPIARWGGLLSTLLMVVAVVALALWGFNSTFFNPSRTNTPAEDPTPATAPAPGDASQRQGVSEAEAETESIPRTVRLSVSSQPAGAEVSVDEFPLPGTTPIESAPVTARPSRTIRVTLDGYQPAEAEFDLTFDRNLSFALTPATAAARESDEEVDPDAQGADGVENAGVADDPDIAAGGEPAAEAGGGPSGDAPQATLTISEDTWLEVYQGTARNQGQRLAFTTARAGQRLTFPLPIYVHVGNAGGVELSVEGQERGALGSSGEVRGLVVRE